MSTTPSLIGSDSSRRAILACALLILAAFAAYHNSFFGPFVYDDVPAIKDNPTIRQLWPIATVLSPPNDSGVTVNGRPLLNLTLALNYAIGGTDAVGYHIFNLLVHTAAGLFLFGFVRRTLELPTFRGNWVAEHSLTLAFTIALIWTVHPLQTESVTYIIQRAESLVGMFYLATFYCFLCSIESPRATAWQILAVLACLCGMASKEVMASAPLLVLFFDRACVSGSFRAALYRHGRLYLGLAATWLLLAYLVANTGNRGGTAGFGVGGISSWHYALTSAFAIGKYLKLAFWPHPLVFDYGTELQHELLPVLPQGLMIVFLLGTTGYALWRYPMLGFLGLWFFAILGPSSSFIPIASEPLAEHRMYLPLASILALVAIAGVKHFGRSFFIVLFLFSAVAAMLTVRRNEVYWGELSIWRDTQHSYPSGARAQNNVGEILFRQEKFDEAIGCFREAVRLSPGYTDAINNLGNSLTQRGFPNEGLPFLRRALSLNPKYAETHNNLGNAYYRLGRATEALHHYREAVRLKPQFAEAHNNLGVLLAEQGDDKEALEHYIEALRFKDAYIDAHYNYANSLGRTGRIDQAISEFWMTISLKSTHAEAFNNLGGLIYNQGKATEAERYYRAAIRLKPDYPEALNNLGSALVETGRTTEAVPFFEAALRLKPDYPDARRNIAEAFNILGAQSVQSGNMSDAKQNFERALQFNPNHASAHNNLGVVLWRSGYPIHALPYFEAAIRLKPDLEDAIKALTELRAFLAAPKK